MYSLVLLALMRLDDRGITATARPFALEVCYGRENDTSFTLQTWLEFGAECPLINVTVDFYSPTGVLRSLTIVTTAKGPTGRYTCVPPVPPVPLPQGG